jgi:ABC-2 type transport system ATP-binding protein
MRSLILDVHRATGTTFLISSHILSELDLVATRFGFIDGGV